jgi:DNA polymerase-3 subunit delta'
MGWQLVGHDWAVDLLRSGLETGRMAHAYLFCGPPQVGKTRLALTLAQALNCDQPDPPCGRCPSCQKIERSVHPDVRLVVGKGADGSILIDQIRELQREAVLSPYEGRRRVFVLRQIDLVTIEAANSLLKTLEEPPPHVTLLLTAVDVDLLPSTVVSRCQRLDLRPVALYQIEAALQARGVLAERARLLARLSGGRIGWAMEAAADEEVLDQRRQRLEQLAQLLAVGRVERLEYAHQVGGDAVACRDLVELWATWWRDLLVLNGQGDAHLLNVDGAGELRLWASQSSVPLAWSMLDALQETAAQLEANVNPRLAMEGLLLKLPRWQPR